LRRELTLLFRAVGHLDRQHLGGGIDAHDFASGPNTDQRKRIFGCASSSEVHAIKVYDGNSKRRRLRSYGISIAREAHMAKKAAAKRTAGRKKAAKRELIDTRTDKRYVTAPRERAQGEGDR
jgi:hypothetical protein